MGISKSWMMHCMAPRFVSWQLRRCCHCPITLTSIFTLSLAGEEIDGENIEIDMEMDSDDEDDDWRKALWNTMRMNLGLT